MDGDKEDLRPRAKGISSTVTGIAELSLRGGNETCAPNCDLVAGGCIDALLPFLSRGGGCIDALLPFLSRGGG
jgi:hypothetical protein